MKFNPDDILPYWCNRSAFLFRALFDQRAEPLGLKWAEGVIMLKLSVGHNTLAELTRNLEHSHPAILRHVDKLEEMGLIERTAHPDDRRIKILTLTVSGQQKVAGLQQMATGLARELQDRFGKERITQAIELLKDIAATYSDEAAPWCPALVETESNAKGSRT